MNIQNEQYLLRKLGQHLEVLAPFVLAFSGGLDSRFLAHVAHSARLPFEAVHVEGPHVSPKQSELALNWLKKRNIVAHRVQFNPLPILDVQLNSKNRCYACKKEMFLHICALSRGRPVLEGSNKSDLSKFRPGLRAIEELGVISPLAFNNIGKPQIISLAKATGLDNPEQPSRPCLLTRFEYGMTPSEELLKKITAAEEEIFNEGFNDFRLRLRQEEPPLLQVAWAEAAKMEQKQAKLQQILNWHGFENVEIHAEINLSGYFDLPS